MKLLIYTANLGNFEKPQKNEPQGFDYWECTDKEFPPRFNAMTPRLQARIVKMFGWQFKPSYDAYLWVDSSCRLPVPDSAMWFMDQLGKSDIAVFKHPDRQTIQEEADYLRERLVLEKEGRKKPYILPRYENEDIDGALSEVNPQAPLYASTAFIYRNTPEVQEALKQWWYLCSRYHSIDQLGLTSAISGLRISVIEANYSKCDYLESNRAN